MRDHRDRLLHLVEIGALPGTAAVMEAISNTTEIIKQRLAETPNPVCVYVCVCLLVSLLTHVSLPAPGAPCWLP